MDKQQKKVRDNKWGRDLEILLMAIDLKKDNYRPFSRNTEI